MSELCSLRELGIEFIDGDRGSNYPKSNEFTDDGECLFLGAHNITESGFSFERTQFISAEKDAILRKGKIQRGDIVLMTRGTWGAGGAVGNVALYDDKVPFDNIRINSVMLIIRCGDNYSPELLYYLFRSSLIRNQIDKIVTGSVQNQLTAAVVSQLKVPRNPKVSVKLLQDIDQKLLINKKQISLLESMDKTLYDYWFVQFDFPDANGTPYKTSGGKMEWNENLSREIPAGWEVKKIKEIADVIAGGDKPEEYSAIKTEKYTVPIYTNGVDKDGLYGYCEAGRVNEDSITIGARGNIGYTKFRQGGYLPIIRLISVTPKDQRYLEYLGFFLKDYPYRKNGSVQNQLPVPDVEDILIVVPDVSLVKKYHEQASLCLNKYYLIKDEMEELCSLRDFLLPMLMNGQVTFNQ